MSRSLFETENFIKIELKLNFSSFPTFFRPASPTPKFKKLG